MRIRSLCQASLAQSDTGNAWSRCLGVRILQHSVDAPSSRSWFFGRVEKVRALIEESGASFDVHSRWIIARDVAITVFILSMYNLLHFPFAEFCF